MIPALNVCFVSPTPVERHARAGARFLNSRFRGNDAKP
jgi:hypothetical protein